MWRRRLQPKVNKPPGRIVSEARPPERATLAARSMTKRDYIDFQDRSEPLAFLITFRSYGTWLHGEERGSIDRRNYNRYGTPSMPPNKRLLAEETRALRHAPVVLNREQRTVVEDAIREVCVQRKYTLHAVNARSNHVHSVVMARCKPEHVLNSFKSYATRRLRETNVSSLGATWKHAVLLTEEELQRAIEYVINGQGDEPFR